MTKLTVLSLTYNHENFVEKTLESFLQQETDFPVEFIISDDASTDNTQVILKKYQASYPDKLHIICNTHNVGAEQHWFDCCSKIKSQYFLYCDGDDYFIDPLKLQKQVDYLENHPECSLCFHPVIVVQDDGSECNTIFPTPADRFHKTMLDVNDLLVHNFIQTNSCMYRWRFNDHENIKDFYPVNILPGDHFMHLLHAQKGSIGFINEMMAVYRKHVNSMWHNANKNSEWFTANGVKSINFYKALENLFKEDRSCDLQILVGKITVAALHLKKFDILEKMICDYSNYFDGAMQILAQSYDTINKGDATITHLKQVISRQNVALEEAKKVTLRQQRDIEKLLKERK